VQPTVVVEIKIATQTICRISHIPILIKIDLFIFDGPPEPFREDIVKNPASTIHTDGYPRLLQPGSKITTGKLAALVGVKYLRTGQSKSLL
jgi:hypothetical protein